MKRHRDNISPILYGILSIIAGISILAMGGCGTDREPKSGKWKILRRADWEARFYDVFFVDKNIGWAVGKSRG